MFVIRVLQEIASIGVDNNILASPQDDQRRSDHAVLIKCQSPRICVFPPMGVLSLFNVDVCFQGFCRK